MKRFLFGWWRPPRLDPDLRATVRKGKAGRWGFTVQHGDKTVAMGAGRWDTWREATRAAYLVVGGEPGDKRVVTDHRTP